MKAPTGSSPSPRWTLPQATGVIIAFVAAVVLTKLLARSGGWAELDATQFHFAIIDYFITNGFDWNYPQVAPMYPGMHAFFAGIARALHLGPLVPTDWAAFAIQSIWGILYVGMATAIVIRTRTLTNRLDQPLLFLILVCSSYPIASWIWPTTELGAYASMYGLVAVSLGRAQLSLREALLFAGLAVISTLFRQTYAVFALSPVAVYALASLSGRTPFRAATLAIQTIPLIAVGVIVAAFTLKWGGLVAPEMAKAGMVSHMEFDQITNLVGLIGLVGFPFVILSLQLLRGDRWLIGAIAAASGVAAIAADRIWPMIYDHSIGHFGSLIWAVVQYQEARHLGHLPLISLLALGFFVLLTLLWQCWRERMIEPELILFGLMAGSLLPQSYVFQRYSEVAFLSLLGIALLRRVPVAGKTSLFLYAWFGAYLLVSFARPIAAISGLSG